MATYTEKVPIGIMRGALGVLGIFAVVIVCICLATGIRETWFFALVAIALAYYCLLRAVRGYHFSTRDDGEP